MDQIAGPCEHHSIFSVYFDCQSLLTEAQQAKLTKNLLQTDIHASTATFTIFMFNSGVNLSFYHSKK